MSVTCVFFKNSFPYRVEAANVGNFRATFLIFSMCTFCGYIFSTHIVPETAGVSLEEIDEVFGSDVGREELELRKQV